MSGSDLDELRARYENAYSLYQNCVAAVSLAQTDEEGVPEFLLSRLGDAAEALRSARRQYRAALTRAAVAASAADQCPSVMDD